MPDAAPDGLLAQAVAAHRQGRLDEAEALYREILSVSPAHFDALHMLGVLHAQRRDYPAAIALIAQATAIRPDNATAHCNLAKALGGCGRLADAVESYDAALRIDPDQPEAQYKRGSALFTLRRFEEAVASYDEVLRLWPDNSRALNNRGNALRGLGRLPEALTSYDRALEIAPDFAEAWGNRGNALQTLGRLAESLESYDRAIALSPDFAEAYCNRGITLEMLGRLQESLESYDRALRITPDHAETYNNRGGVLLNLGRASEALASFDRALAIKPDYADAHVNAGMCRLVTGDFAKGWQEFEWRWTAALEPSRPDLDGPAWLGAEPLQGKMILLWCEQGLGDSIQFCRFAKVLAARGATVFLWVHTALESLMLGLEGPERILRAGEKVPKTDYHCALLSVPLALKLELGSIPAERQYLFADPERVEAWGRKLGPRRRPRIGFACSGNPNHRNDRNRSIPFAQFDRIIDGPCEFFCLQKDIREDDQALLSQRPDIGQFCDELGDFEDTAALIQHMDLIITVDTSIAHLAAALGRPVWILLPFNADWRWLMERTDSPWYPTALLLRQPASGDWESVLSDVTQRLAAMEFAASGLEAAACDDAARAARRRDRARVGRVLAQAVAAMGNWPMRRNCTGRCCRSHRGISMLCICWVWWPRSGGTIRRQSNCLARPWQSGRTMRPPFTI
jgi:tetratricopeptide (TPR) repeat protein